MRFSQHTIETDGEPPGIRVGVGDVTIAEGDAGTRTALVPVTVSALPGTATVTVPFTLSSSTATWSKTPAAGGDYGGPQSGTLTFTGSTVLKTDRDTDLR